LIEMLVALLIISIGLLGVAGLQAYSLKNNASAYNRSQANALIYDIIDAMRSNRQEALAGKYVLAVGASPGGSGQALDDLTDWVWRVGKVLPSGTAAVTCSSGAEVVCSVTLWWDDARRGVTTTDQMQEMTVSTRL
jgi:type IV pilus assembly protein PilV